MNIVRFVGENLVMPKNSFNMVIVRMMSIIGYAISVSMISKSYFNGNLLNKKQPVFKQNAIYYLKFILKLYDAIKTSYAQNVWDAYFYEKNLQGDVVAVYSESGAKLVSYISEGLGYSEYILKAGLNLLIK